MRYFIKFSYDGSSFNGFQKQPNKKTIQGEIEQTLQKINQKEVNIHASGRTDKGVHALEQCAHFDLDKKINKYNLQKYLNNNLDGEIYIKTLEEITNNFHARYNVKRKIYSYYINTGTYSPTNRNYIYQLCKNLNINRIKKATKYLIGKHDFRSFCTDEKNKENCIRTIKSIKVKQTKDIVKITFEADGFLRKMIRNIIAILIEIGLEQQKPIYIKEVLENKSRKGNLKCIPGCGLYLEKVIY